MGYNRRKGEMMRPIGKGDALLVVDMQKDFIVGSLAVESAGEIILEINRLIHTFRSKKLEVWYSMDWHEEEDGSFISNGGDWPIHCVKNTDGATMHPDVYIYDNAKIIFKSQNPNVEEYSAFLTNIDGSQMDIVDVFKSAGVKRVFIVGLAIDFCVGESAKSALAEGFEVVLVRDAIRGVFVEGSKTMLGELVYNGARIW